MQDLGYTKYLKLKIRNELGETNPLKLNLPKISSLDYFSGYIYIPDMNGDMIILENVKNNQNLTINMLEK